MKKQDDSMLKSARLKKSWTPEYVSGRVGVSLSTYMRWEAGLQTPRSSSLNALCQIFEMSPEELGFTTPFPQSTKPPPPPLPAPKVLILLHLPLRPWPSGLWELLHAGSSI
ncbi:helix-turn-helix transcriptional regulator [Ktedonosporobacter rubrisoli]|nr:helix-turn-helix transcriptional regulator [Ktedonosporobacter rubrisoli]